MKNILKRANVQPDASIINAATDQKKFSPRRIFNFIVGIMFFGASLFALGAFIYIVFGTPGKWDGMLPSLLGIGPSDHPWLLSLFALLFYGTFMFVIFLGCLMLGIYLIRVDTKWFIILYPESILYLFRPNDDTKEFTRVTVPIEKIDKGYILRKSTKSKVISKDPAKSSRVTHHISIHLEYQMNEETHYISLSSPDGMKAINNIIIYLQNEGGIPFYFTAVGPKGYEEIDDLKALKMKEPEPIEFSGNLKDYNIWNRKPNK